MQPIEEKKNRWIQKQCAWGLQLHCNQFGTETVDRAELQYVTPQFFMMQFRL